MPFEFETFINRRAPDAWSEPTTKLPRGSPNTRDSTTAYPLKQVCRRSARPAAHLPTHLPVTRNHGAAGGVTKRFR